MCNHCKPIRDDWDSLLTEEEKAYLKDVQCSVDLRRLEPKAVKELLAAFIEMFADE